MAVWAVWLAAASGLYFFENNTGTRVILAAALMAPALSAIMAHYEKSRPFAFTDEQTQRVAVFRLDVAQLTCKEHL